PMPPTYLAWSIVAMLVCCVVTGIVALIYSTKVSSRYYAGDYEGARKASENTAIWLAVTIVCGLIAIPFQVVLSML
ncbi:CD225/dispanin family protein, partial [Paramuribaculum intestinale]